MKRMMPLLTALLLSVGLSACSEMPQQQADGQAVKDEPEYITGSHLPLKKTNGNGAKVSRMTPQEIEAMQRQQSQMMPDGMGSK